ncbi:MAG: hypothetical protein EBU85_04150 [Actinobacteria bacterium]|nr:hypothetical protein [Actinomycetota bacterium]
MSFSDSPTVDAAAELADLRKRRDIKEMSASEIELLATKTAAMMIEAAHTRESAAESKATSLLADASRQVQSMLAEAEAEVRKVVSAAQAEAAKLIATAEAESAGLRRELQTKLGDIDGERRRLLDAAHREARELVAEAETKAAKYTAWLRRQVDDVRKIQRGLSDRLVAIAEASKSHDDALSKAASALDELHKSSDPSTQI